MSGVVYYTWFEVAWLIKLRTFLKGRLKLYSDFVLQISCFIAILLYCTGFYWFGRFLLGLVWKYLGKGVAHGIWFNRSLYIEQLVLLTVLHYISPLNSLVSDLSIEIDRNSTESCNTTKTSFG